MLGFVCKYTPVELMESMGAAMVRLNPEVTDFDAADAALHPNLCSYVKGVLEEFSERDDLDGIILTSCCDSVRRLYDLLKRRYPEKFIEILDVPRHTNDFASSLYAGRIRELADNYAAWRRERGETPDKSPGEDDPVTGTEPEHRALCEELLRLREASGLRKAPEGRDALQIVLAGARTPVSLVRRIEDSGAVIRADLTCTSMDRAEKMAVHLPEEIRPETVIDVYAKALLNQFPCMRMIRVSGREEFLRGLSDELDGVICHTVKFCDMYSFEYASLKEESLLPMLKLETDLTRQCEGQIRTRVEAFLESLSQRRSREEFPEASAGKENKKTRPEGFAGMEKQVSGAPAHSGEMRTREKEGMFYVGIDSGSTSTNAVVMNAAGEIVSSAVIRTGAKASVSADRILGEVLENAGISRDEVARIVATGYGRSAVSAADRQVTEISCHARGARYFSPEVRTILDIGGQDSKAIRLAAYGKDFGRKQDSKDCGLTSVSSMGIMADSAAARIPETEVEDFVMNDKCAAGTGRFLEAMARTLEVDIKELGPISLKSTEHIDISSMCTVFAESEVISLIAQDKEKADIAAGVHRAIAGKAYGLLSRVGLTGPFMMTGGVARNPGVVKAVEERLGLKLILPPDPDIVGAAGAALYAMEG